jgi:[acyl-carrier-protein] S-malonyltransferase
MPTEVALIFPGQGAQTAGMGKDFYDNSPEAKNIFDRSDLIIEGLTDVIFNGPQEKLTSTQFCQPGIFTFSLAALEAFRAHPKFAEVQPRFTAGLSLGELSAIVCANSLLFEDGLRLVERRASFMDVACQKQKGAMAAVIGFEESKIKAICDETGAEVANYNSPDQIVITGDAEQVKDASLKITEAGAKRVIGLDVSGAFHSSLMASAVPEFEKVLESIDIGASDIEILSNVDGLPTNAVDVIRENLSKQITSSVQWVKTVEFIASQGVKHFVEIGPGTVLKGLIRKINRELTCQNIQKPEDIDKLQF